MIKKLIILLFTILLVILVSSTFSASAQKGFRIGVGGGVGLMNTKSIDLVDTAQTKTYIGPAAWLLTQYGLTNSFALAFRTGVMTQGTINNNAVKYPFNANSLAALQALGIYNHSINKAN